MADFDQSAKGGPFAKFSKWPIFLAELRKLEKIANTSPILNRHFSDNTYFFLALLVSLETRINSASIHTN